MIPTPTCARANSKLTKKGSSFKTCSLYLFLAALGLRCCAGFSLVAMRRGYSLGAMCGLFISMACLVVEHSLKGAQASVVAFPRPWSIGSIVVAPRLSCSMACGIFPD